MVRFPGPGDRNARPEEPPERPPAYWLGGDSFQIGNGQPFNPSGNNVREVLVVLIAHKAAMDGRTLSRASSVSDAPRHLRGMTTTDPKLAPYVHCPGGKSKGGYSVNIFDKSLKNLES